MQLRALGLDQALHTIGTFPANLKAAMNLLGRGGGPAERLAAYEEAQALFQRDMPWAPLYHVSIFLASRRPVRGLSVDSTGVLRYDKTWKAP